MIITMLVNGEEEKIIDIIKDNSRQQGNVQCK